MKMEPVTLAAAVVSLIAGYFGGQRDDLADSAVDLVKKLIDTVRARLSRTTFGEQAVDRVAEKPHNEHRRGALAGILAEVVEQEPEFAATLAELVAEALRTTGGTAVQISDSGTTAVYGNAAIEGYYAAGRDLRIERHDDDIDPRR